MKFIKNAIIVVFSVYLAGCSDIYSKPLSKDQKEVFDFCVEKKASVEIDYTNHRVYITCKLDDERGN